MDIFSISVKVAVGIFFALAMITFLWAYSSSKGIYDDYIEPLDENEFKLKKLLNIGLFLNERISIVNYIPNIARELFGRYSNNVSNKITEIYGYKYSDYYSMVHNGSKWSLFLLGLIGAILFAGINCVNNDLNSNFSK